jgi:hypothetical protein
MPTPTGLPRVGEVWERNVVLPGQPQIPVQAVVLERSQGDYWGLKVAIPSKGGWIRTNWVDPAYWLGQGWLRYIGPAGPATRKEVGL